jgi:CheY-like chemotaxis protein
MNERRTWLLEDKQVLGVERDPALIATARSILLELGFAVVIATTLPGAVAACRAHRFDLVLIGSSTPGATADALIDFLAQCGGPPSLRLYRTGREKDDVVGLVSILRGALPA